MKIALFSCHFFPSIGGTEKAMENLAFSLHKHGHQVKIFTPEHRNKDVDYSKFPFEVINVRNMLFTSKNDVFSSTKPTAELLEKVKEFSPDIINCHGSWASFKLSLKISKKLNIPLITTMHTKTRLFYENQYGKNWLGNFHFKKEIKTWNKGKFFISVSESLNIDFKKSGFKNDFWIIKNGVEIENFTKEQKEIFQNSFYQKYPQYRNKLILSCVARVEKFKNFEFSLNVIAKLKKQINNILFIVVGDGSALEYFKNLAKELEIEENVLFTGMISKKEDITEIYSVSKIHLFPSIFDNDSLAISEAASLDVPSLVIEYSGSSERFSNGLNAIIEKEEVDAVAKRLIKELNDFSNLEQMGKQAKAVYKNWEEVSKDYLECYKKAIEQSKNNSN